ncbi:MAG TPA: single-stranded-DNA-specific exonuclease RecJ [Terriglobales bacterium]|jgi:single-stranded-DNA-specific exonuclease|nr:single-stranded-DNA-specific exonuclease RecJ [Terriglobales bacterium]
MRWFPKHVDTAIANELSQSLLGVHLPLKKALALEEASLLARLLISRGVNDGNAAKAFLFPTLSDLHSSFLMSGMKTALERLEAAIERKEKILIYGDYDVDGTTAIVILKTAIELCGGSADFHVPHRIREGYGMKDEVIERAAADGVRLIVSVDTGIRAFAAADTARRTGIDLIVTDHHLPGTEGVPTALAVLNPNQDGCGYPCKALCGAGVAFKLAQGLMERKLDRPDQSRLLMSFMKVVAIATIADAVPLTGENRVFAKLGLEALRAPVNVGLKALLEVAQLGGKPLTSSEVAFRVAPRLNAAGRMDVARDVIDLFSVKDPVQAREIASRLDKLNAERQEEERRILDEITKRLEQEPALHEAFCIVIDGDGWHRGVIGITASRVVDKYCKPTLIISRDGEEAHGSGRSIRAFHLLQALESCRDLFSRYGGHAHAVGFALPSAKIVELRSQLDAHARTCLTTKDFEPSLEYDAEIDLSDISPSLHRLLQQMEPFGQGNPEPVLVARGARVLAPPKIVKDKHVKLKLATATVREAESLPTREAAVAAAADAATLPPRCHPDGAAIPQRRIESNSSNWRRNVAFDAMGWRLAEIVEQNRVIAGDMVDVAFTLDVNEHPEFGGLEMSLRDLRKG